MFFEKIKIPKPLLRSMNDAGIQTPTELQERILPRIRGGQDLIAIGPEGSGKTTSYVLAILSRIRQGFGDAPRAIVLLPDESSVALVAERFALFNQNKTIRVIELTAAGRIEAQMDELAHGADIVLATPDRARAVYLKLGLNMNKIDLFVVDDAAEIIRKGMQLPMSELIRSVPKCQRLIFTEFAHEKLLQLLEPYLNNPAEVEVKGKPELKIETVEQFLYRLPDFPAKSALLYFLLKDQEMFDKVIVFVNTRLTASRLYNHLSGRFGRDAALYKPLSFEQKGFDDISLFLANPRTRILIVADELEEELPMEGVSFMFHLELPQQREIYIQRVRPSERWPDLLAITLATDTEMLMVKKIEQVLGSELPVQQLPEGFYHDNEKPAKASRNVKTEEEIPKGSAFHEKKEKNSKTYNYSSKEKAQMKHRNRK